MNKVVFQFEGGGDVTIFAAPGENLLDLARKANVVIDAPCSGNGSCGKCRVQLMSGDLKSRKSLHLEDLEFNEGWRLACSSTVLSDVKVMVPDIASAYKSRMKTADLSSPEELRLFNELQANLQSAGLTQAGYIRTFAVTMDTPTLSDTMPDNERFTRAVCEATGADNVIIPFFVLKKLPDLLRDNDFALRCVGELFEGTMEILDLSSDRGSSPVCGLAVDIGTTTVTGVLVDIATGAILSKASAGNGQIRYGADVINRIVEQQKTGGIDKLQKAIIGETLLPLIETMCGDAGIRRNRIYHITVASNTTMNHLLLGLNADYIRTEPYVPAFFNMRPVLTRALGIELAPAAKLSLAPNIGSYVGGDITAGALASMIWNTPKLSMLIDLGTNGEIVFGSNEFLMSCACSAGPAFEGGDISCGMRATHGAIEAVIIDRETMAPTFKVIGKIRPVGLCGSGIIDLIAELFGAGIINGKGKFVREGRRVRHDEFDIGAYVLAFPEESASGRLVAITEVDIDNFIRAKGAIFSAIMTLITSLGFTPDMLEHVQVAGGIGSGINIRNAVRIGMFPDLPLEKYTYIGNSALAGAYAMLTSEDAAIKLFELSKTMTYLELSTQPGYMDSFIAACFLPHTDASLFPSVSDAVACDVNIAGVD
jgi:uncharacterized 2Fe-2S/4Fe-4S cluster protein (DUF4445 family)